MNEQNRMNIELQALQVWSLLTVAAETDTDNKEALEALPQVCAVARDMAQAVYKAIADKSV